MFSKDFYPTPETVIQIMLEGIDVSGKTVLEPSAGKGNIVDHLTLSGCAEVLACEIDPSLRTILKSKCSVIAEDFLTVESHQLSHIHLIVMNPPFSADEKHILHAFDVAPPGCTVVALCNSATLKNPYSRSRAQLSRIVEEYGASVDLADCFSGAERQTHAEIALLRLQKPGSSYDQEFEGFFLEEDPAEEQGSGLISYNVIRDIVNRYVEAVKIFDETIEVGLRMVAITAGFFKPELAIKFTQDGVARTRNDFKKALQKDGWNYIIGKMNMQKYATKGLREDINKFVEQQHQVPFTMRNIYQMLEIIVGTTEQRMDKAILEVFDRLTMRYHENRYNLEGWKTNSHYLVNQKFILEGICPQDKRWNTGDAIEMSYSSTEVVEDLAKALCYIKGEDYDKMETLDTCARYKYQVVCDGQVVKTEMHYSSAESIARQYRANGQQATVVERTRVYGEWFDWGFFEVKAFKKGTMHFKFKSEDIWSRFNQRVAKIKGYPLYENVRREPAKAKSTERPTTGNVLFEI